jgi:hypothetical protein
MRHRLLMLPGHERTNIERDGRVVVAWTLSYPYWRSWIVWTMIAGRTIA